MHFVIDGKIKLDTIFKIAIALAILIKIKFIARAIELSPKLVEIMLLVQ